MRFWIVTIMLLLTTGLLQAQEQTPYEIALERILEAERTGAIELDLMFIDLTQLPPEIGNLSNLQELWLSGNDLTIDVQKMNQTKYSQIETSLAN